MSKINFDFNQITPGTPFMLNVSKELRKYYTSIEGNMLLSKLKNPITESGYGTALFSTN